MSTVIKGGTTIAADRSYEADILIEGENHLGHRQGSEGRQGGGRREALTSCRAASTRTPISKCRSWAPPPPRPGRAAPCGAVGGTTLVVDFVIPGEAGMIAALDDWEGKAKRQASSDYSLHMCVNGWSKQTFRRDAEGDRARHQHLQALHGLQGRADGERRRNVRLVPALRSAWRAAAGACRERRHRRRTPAEIHERGQYRTGGACLFASAGGGGRGDQPRHHDRRRRRRAGLHRAYFVRAGA